MSHVAYILPQTEGEASLTSDRAVQNGPIRLFLIDILILFRNFAYIPYAVLPLRKLSKLAGLPEREKRFHLRDTIVNFTVTLLETVLLLFVSIPIYLMIPGWLWIVCVALISVLILAIQSSTWGAIIVQSETSLSGFSSHSSERWFFVNGISTSHNSLQITCDRLAATFKRPITGIHNRSYGIIGDVLECLVQRCLRYSSLDVRTAYQTIEPELFSPQIGKVVIIAHSQGGILTSLVLDRMLAELPRSYLGKLEIYTFGSAAAHFNNPVLLEKEGAYDSELQTGCPSTAEISENVVSGDTKGSPRVSLQAIPVIEHYCNRLDPVPRWGVLYSVKDRPTERYAGQVFIRQCASGHLFNEHYLDAMFHLDPKDGEVPFLDEMVEVDEENCLERMQAMAVMSGERKGICSPESSTSILDFATSDMAVTNHLNIRDDINAAVEGGRRRTVRELSKLWKYMNGGKVDP